MIFEDRVEAGRMLAERLASIDDAVVVSIPRGGVEVGATIARMRAWPQDIVVPRKLRAPHNPELAIGAIAPGVRVLDDRAVHIAGASEGYLEGETAAQEEEIERRTNIYRSGRDPIPFRGKVAVVVDDGLATGATAIAAVRWVRAQGAGRVILAVPVAPAEAIARLRTEADEVVCLEVPDRFYAVGQWYRTFDQTSDDEVIRLLGGS